MRATFLRNTSYVSSIFHLKNSAQSQKLTLPLHVPENYLFLATHQSFLCIFWPHSEMNSVYQGFTCPGFLEVLLGVKSHSGHSVSSNLAHCSKALSHHEVQGRIKRE